MKLEVMKQPKLWSAVTAASKGFSPLYGAVFVIETGKVVDYAVLSRHCSGCQKWGGGERPN